MANPTTNYGWPMPTSTDLVTDLPADFALFGQPVDTSLKALNPETTLGDIAYRSATSNTNTRLGIGSTSQVLTVAGGVPTWATPAVSASALTLIKARTTFTSVATTGTTFDNLFSATYRTYLIVIDQFSSASAADAQLQMLYSGTTQSTANYYNAHQYITWGGAATIVNATGATVNNLGAMSAGANISNFTVKVYSPQDSSTNWKWTWDGYSPTWQGVGQGGCFLNASQTYTGIKMSASAGNITGAITVYGMATS